MQEYRDYLEHPKTWDEVISEHDARKLRKELRGRYGQTAEQFIRGPAESRRRIADSFEFKANTERYDKDGEG